MGVASRPTHYWALHLHHFLSEQESTEVNTSDPVWIPRLLSFLTSTRQTASSKGVRSKHDILTLSTKQGGVGVTHDSTVSVVQLNKQGRSPEELGQEGGVKGAQKDDMEVVEVDGGQVREGFALVGRAAARKLVASVHRNTSEERNFSM